MRVIISREDKMANIFDSMGNNKRKEKMKELEMRIDNAETYIETMRVRDKKDDGLLTTGQNYYTKFMTSDDGVADKLGKNEALYRYLYVRGSSDWFDGNYSLGFKMVNHAYAERFVSTYAKYCFQEINANVINGTTRTTNVITKDKMINYVQNALLYRKVLVRLKLYPDLNKFEKIYYDWQLDVDNNPIILYENHFLKEVYNEELGKYVWIVWDKKDKKITSEISKKVEIELNRLNSINIECPYADYIFEIPFESDVVRKAMGICHKLDKANSKLNWESDIGSTMVIIPNGMVRGYKSGTQLFRTMDIPNNDMPTEAIKPLIVKTVGGIEDAIKEITHLKDELSETTHINFLSEVNGEQTATEFKGREKPFIQSINEINNIFFPIVKRMYQQISQFYSINVDELELPEFELHTETQTQLIANGISQISTFPDPIVQAEVVGMFMNYSKKQVDELAKRLQEQDNMIDNFNSSLNIGSE